MASPLPLLLISGYGPRVAAFRVDPRTGALTPAASSECGVNPSYAAFSPDGRTAYVVSETASGAVGAFAVAASTGALARVGDAVPAEGDDPCHVSVSPCGRWVAVSNYTSGSLTLLRVTPGGGLAPHWTSSPGRNAHQAVWHGGRLYAPFLGSDAVLQYRLDAEAGALAPLPGAPAAALPPGAGPRHLAFAPDGGAAFVLNELGCTLTSFAVDPATGGLVEPATVSTLPPGVAVAPGYSTAHVVVSPDGRFVVASNRGHNSLAVFAVGAPPPGSRTPSLEPVCWEDGGGDVAVPRDFALSPDPAGALVVVANQAADSVTVFARDAASGRLAKLATTPLPAGSKPCFVGWVPRGGAA